MLQSPVPPSYSLRARRKNSHSPHSDDEEVENQSFIIYQQGMDDYDDDFDNASGSKGRAKSRRELPTGAVAVLKAWLLSPEHFTHPYPTPQDQQMLMQKTGIDKKQLKNWFTNARRRIWKPLLKKQLEQGKITAAPGLGLPGMPTSMASDNPHSIQAMRAHYQQAFQDTNTMPQPATTNDSYENYEQSSDHYYGTQPEYPQSMPNTSSIGTLPQISSTTQLSKTDSHAVLMELFARDQDLVRQATESARLKAEQKQQAQPGGTQPIPNQHPMKGTQNQTVLHNVPTLNSWPHFSSITSLNNLGTIPGVKSIASLSGNDLASKGSMNRMGNLAQVKSMESMGKNDSYAFLEVFFGDRSSNNLSGMASQQGRGSTKANTDNEDNEIGLDLDGDAPSPTKTNPPRANMAPSPAPMSQQQLEMPEDRGTLKRAYDDALAARGLMSVSRSNENLKGLVLPEKMQRTLSQDFIQKQYQQQQQGSSLEYDVTASSDASSQQYPGISSDQHQHVQVSTTTTCAMCLQTDVDTQLRPCGHMFHERCLKPSLQNPSGSPPKCPLDNIPMQSALLAVPTEDIRVNGNAGA